MSDTGKIFSVLNIISGALNPVTVMLAVLVPLVSQLPAELDTLHNALVAVKAQQEGGSLYLLGQANTIFPVFEVLTMLGLLFALRVAAAVVRTIKAWIPTVS